MQRSQLLYEQASVSCCSHLSVKRDEDIKPAVMRYQGRKTMILASFRVWICQCNVSKMKKKKKKEICVFSVFPTSVLRKCKEKPEHNCAANKK